MKFTLLLVVVFAFDYVPTFAQGKAGASGASPTAASSSTNQSTPQQGFVYFLRSNKHLQYATCLTENYNLTYQDLCIDNNQEKIFSKPVKRDTKYTVSIILDRWPDDNPKSDTLNFTEYTIRSLDVQTTNYPADRPFSPDELDTVLSVKVRFYDSIPRYWAGTQKERLSSPHLRIALTQDSVILLTRIFDNDFNSKAPKHLAFVTNPNYRGTRARDALQRPFYSGPRPRDHRPLQVIEKKMFLPTLKQFDTAADKASIYTSLFYEYKTVLETAYEDHQDSLTDEEKKGMSRRDKKKRQKTLQDEFYILNRDYDSVIWAYGKLCNPLRFSIDSLHKIIADPATRKPYMVLNAILYFQLLDAFYHTKAQNNAKDTIIFPGKIAVRPQDDLIPETAIPIDGEDSAGNFYFRTIHKALMYQSIYHQPFSYATWDYGALTIPYRYRFSPRNKYVYTSPGKDSSAPATSASEAAINVSFYIGRKWGRTRFYEDPTMSHNTLSGEVAFVTGPTLVAMTAANVDTLNHFTGIRRAYAYTGPSNIIAWSVGLGGVLQVRTINFGAFGGLDFPLQGNTGWIYSKHFWLGFGIGVNLGMFASGHSVN
jgi:hypothetical protein